MDLAPPIPNDWTGHARDRNLANGICSVSTSLGGNATFRLFLPLEVTNEYIDTRNRPKEPKVLGTKSVDIKLPARIQVY